MGLHLEGIENAIDMFDRADTVLKSSAILEVFQTAGEAIGDTARAMAPVYEGPERSDVTPGTLRDAIFVKAYQKDTVPYVLIGVREADAPYGPFQEFGTENTPAHPFMRQAAAEWEGRIEDIVASAIAALIA